MGSFEIHGQLVDLDHMTIYPGSLLVENGSIQEIRKLQSSSGPFIIPGFVDAHVHIESSMLIPSEFARLAVTHGTVATVSDPHEIGNVLGVDGVKYMIENGKQVNFKYYFGAPSCVPATSFETAGDSIDADDIEYLLSNPEIKYLAEMMNWPGVLNGDPQVMEKIKIAHRLNKPVDGHAPGLRGQESQLYAEAGISTDHECYTIEEALDKLRCGMHILIREGSAAKNFDALIPLLPEYAEKIMFCTDDMHPDNLLRGHINLLVKRAVSGGIDPLVALRAGCKNPVLHYGLEVGLLKVGDPADFLMIQDLKDFKVIKTFINGKMVAEEGKSQLASVPSDCPNNFSTKLKRPEDFMIKSGGRKVRVLVAEDGQLVTRQKIMTANLSNGLAKSDVERDMLKMTVVNRYRDTSPSVAFVQNFGLKHGAIASSVAHDSHNIIAVGVDDQSICKAVNCIIEEQGGVAAVSGDQIAVLPLPVAGLMSADDGYEVANRYMSIDAMAKELGSGLSAPFMTLSFMALLVIPSLKLSDQGLFNGDDFKFVSLFVD
jgi:adenine deaminase